MIEEQNTLVSLNNVNNQVFLGWQNRINLFPEMVEFICAIQDEVVPTRSRRRNIIEDNLIEVRCRICGVVQEIVDYLTLRDLTTFLLYYFIYECLKITFTKYFGLKFNNHFVKLC